MIDKIRNTVNNYIHTMKPECHSRTFSGVKPDRADNSMTSASVSVLPNLSPVPLGLLPIFANRVNR